MSPFALLTNDDGPPGSESPYIYGLYRHLTRDLGWDVRVVIPSSQKSWIGKAYQITDVIVGRYFYPRDPDGFGETSSESRPLKDGEIAEWILLDGTPATCANVALHNLYPGQVDLVLSGPNLGRNTSASFALSSGTIGAALSSSLSLRRSIALSYGTVLRPTPKELFQPAHELSGRIIQYLWQNWGKDAGGLRNGEVDLYNVNIPMINELIDGNGLEIYWTKIWRNAYGRLFKEIPPPDSQTRSDGVEAAGPDSLTQLSGRQIGQAEPNAPGSLFFKFSPDINDLIHPSPSSLPIGSDGWAIHKGSVSVTPLRASFAEPPRVDHPLTFADPQYMVWKLKL